MCVCVCSVCVCKTKSKTKRERERESHQSGMEAGLLATALMKKINAEVCVCLALSHTASV